MLRWAVAAVAPSVRRCGAAAGAGVVPLSGTALRVCAVSVSVGSGSGSGTSSSSGSGSGSRPFCAVSGAAGDDVPSVGASAPFVGALSDSELTVPIHRFTDGADSGSSVTLDRRCVPHTVCRLVFSTFFFVSCHCVCVCCCCVVLY